MRVNSRYLNRDPFWIFSFIRKLLRHNKVGVIATSWSLTINVKGASYTVFGPPSFISRLVMIVKASSKG